MSLSSSLIQNLQSLEFRSASVKAVTGMAGEENRFTIAMQALDRLATEQQLPIAIVGGLAAIHYGYPAVTEDIDVAVGSSHLDQLVVKAPAYGFKVVWKATSGWHTLMFGDVEINVIPEGGKAKDSAPTAIPGPQAMGVQAGLHFASLPSWIELKISSNRQKDRAHIVEVLKVSSAEAIERIRSHLVQVHEAYVLLFDALASQAEDEKSQERPRRNGE